MRVDNSSDGNLWEEFYAAAYTAHPYQWPVIGWMSDIENITIDDVYDYHNTYYKPNNASIILIGNFKTDEAIKMKEGTLRKAYGFIDFAKPSEALNNFYLSIDVKGMKYKYNLALDSIHTQTTNLEFKNGVLAKLGKSLSVFSIGRLKRELIDSISLLILKPQV